MKVPSERVLAPGDAFGPYRIVGLLGRGGMGVVYRAQDGEGRACALKVVSQALATDEVFLKRFRREGRAAKSLSHPNVTALLDSGEEDGTPFLAFEYLAGGTLREMLRTEGSVPWRRAALVGAGIARGLAAVHAAGLVHRDLKPENVLLDENGTPKLADFGLVGGQGTQLAVSAALTKTGQIMGTLEYMAPEQADGKGSAGPGADLYALGALLYALLVGRPPFQGVGYELLKKHLDEKPVPPRELVADLPVALDRLVLELLAKDAEDRPATAGEVAERLDAIARGVASGGRSSTGAKLALVLAPLLGVGLALAFASWPREGEAPSPSPGPKPPDSPSSVANAKPPRPAESPGEKARRLAASAKNVLDAKGDPGKALDDAKRAVDLDPKLALAWLCRGEARRRQGDRDGGLADLERSLELDERSASAHDFRGLARRAGGDLKGALEDFTREVELAPDAATGWANRSALRLITGDFAGCEADATRAIELDPNSPYAWGNRGEARGQLQKLEEALADLTRAVELDPTQAYAWADKGAIRDVFKDYEGALADYTKAIEVDPTFAQAWSNRGLLRAKDLPGRGRDLAGAEADLTRAIELQPTRVDAWKTRGMIRRMAGDRRGAIADTERFLELAPQDPVAPAAREALDEMRRAEAGGK